MNTTQIKICGISTAETLSAVIAARADFVGLNFYPPSPRNVNFETAAELGRQAAGRIAKVGVFVDPSDELLRDAIGSAGLDAVQLHKTTAARRAEIRQRFGAPVWAVIAVKSAADLATCARIDPESADRVLYDAATPKGADLPGGMGVRFDWSLLKGLEHPYPWGLAGGLTPDNVRDAIGITHAPLVDAASGIESAPGVKEVDLIRAFCKAARSTG